MMGAAWCAEDSLTLKSPDGKLSYTLRVNDGKVTQALKKKEVSVLEQGMLGLVVDGRNLAEGVKSWKSKTVAENKTEKFSVSGKQKESEVVYNEYEVEGEGGDLRMMVRMYLDGVAFRYVWPESWKDKASVTVKDESSEFRFPAESVLWTQDAGSALGPCEGIWSSARIGDFNPTDNPRSYIRTAPITVQLPDKEGYALIQESGNYDLNWSGIKFALKDGACKATYFQDPQGFAVVPRNNQPWRVVLVADDLNSLVNNDIIDSLAPEPDKMLFPQGNATDWIKPGRSSWTWWDTSKVDCAEQNKFVDMASEFGFENHLVDEGWKKWDKDYSVCLDKLKELVEYAKGKNVGIWVWIRWSDINKPEKDWEQMRHFLDQMQNAGVRGLKVDFMDSASQERLAFYDAILEKTAKRHLMLNLHGANTPGGEARTWPHEVSREGIYGLEQNKWGGIKGEHYCALPFTRLVSGHADFTGGYFGHDARLRDSTWPMQMATNIIYTSPILHWVSNPADMQAAFPQGSLERDLIKAIPSTWDETRVLPGADIGKYAPFVRRKGNQWFMALMNGADGRTEEVTLDFLPGGNFTMVTLSDLSDRNDGWKVDKKTVKNGDKVTFTMRPSGGGIAWFVPAS